MQSLYYKAQVNMFEVSKAQEQREKKTQTIKEEHYNINKE